MRHTLKSLEGTRTIFYGTVAQFGMKRGYTGQDLPTLMLKDVKDSAGTIVSDHLWFTIGKQLATLQLQVGDVITFHARVTAYEKGYKGYREDVYKPIEVDYRLSNPTNITKVTTAGESNILL